MRTSTDKEILQNALFTEDGDLSKGLVLDLREEKPASKKNKAQNKFLEKNAAPSKSQLFFIGEEEDIPVLDLREEKPAGKTSTKSRNLNRLNKKKDAKKAAASACNSQAKTQSIYAQIVMQTFGNINSLEQRTGGATEGGRIYATAATAA